MDIFDNLQFFDRNENWGNPDLMDPLLLLELDAFRKYLKSPIFISSGTGGQHVKHSLHYQGLAVDVLFPKSKLSLFDIYLIAERFRFNGIGIYPQWKYDAKEIGGLHLDKRNAFGKGKKGYGARWIGYDNMYYKFNEKNLERFKII